MLARDMDMISSMAETLPETTLAIGCSAAIGRDQLGAELVAFGRRRPDVLVGVHEMGRASLVSALRAGELDLGLLPGEPDPSFASVELWRDRAMIALPPGHPLTGKGEVPPEAALDLLFLVSRRSAGAETQRFLTRQLFGDGVCLSSDIRDCGLGRILKMVAEGQGAALLCDSHDYPARAEVAVRPFGGPKAHFGVRAHWVQGRRDPVLDDLLATLAPDQ